jgi:hypothetical protein
MATCSYCGTTILFGGVHSGDQRFCNAKCLQRGQLLDLARQVPANVVEKQVEEVFRGNCPKCNGLGPIDVHRFYEVWSILFMTRWVTSQQVSCRSCATKRQAGALAFSLFCGWWGFPWGLILTPVQVTRNIVAMCGGPDSSQPSVDLRKIVQINLGQQMLASGQRFGRQTPPPIPSQNPLST